MKLEHKGQLIIVCACFVMLAGCKQKSGLELLNSQMASMKAMKSQFVIKEKNKKDVTVDFIYSLPSRAVLSSENFIAACNEFDGHFESVYPDRVYDQTPWDGQAYLGTSKLVNPGYINAGPLTGHAPINIAGSEPWKLEKKSGTVEHYYKDVKTLKGIQHFAIEIDETGKLVKFEAPNGMVFVAKSMEFVDNIPVEKFRVEPRDGFVSHRAYPDYLTVEIGAKFDLAKFKRASDVESFKLDGNTLLAIVDPAEPSSVNAMSWIKSPGSTYKKVAISKGKTDSGFFDPTGAEITKMTSSTPLFVLVDKDSKIIAVWLGFDPKNIKAFEADILKAMTPEN